VKERQRRRRKRRLFKGETPLIFLAHPQKQEVVGSPGEPPPLLPPG